MAVSFAGLKNLHSSEFEFELNPVQKVYPDALMEHIAHLAMEAESEQEAAEGFLPLIPMAAAKLLPLAAKALPSVANALPQVANAMSRVTPQLTRDFSNLTRGLFRNPRTRQLMRTIPLIAKRTVASVVRHAAAGQPITREGLRRTLAAHARQVLGSPQARTTAIRRSAALDTRFHRLAGMPAASASCPGCTARSARAACPTCGQLVNSKVGE
jgi:hypothetical protein